MRSWRCHRCSDRPGVERCLRSPPDSQCGASREGIAARGPGKPHSGTSECLLVYPMWSYQASLRFPSLSITSRRTRHAASVACLSELSHMCLAGRITMPNKSSRNVKPKPGSNNGVEHPTATDTEQWDVDAMRFRKCRTCNKYRGGVEPGCTTACTRF